MAKRRGRPPKKTAKPTTTPEAPEAAVATEPPEVETPDAEGDPPEAEALSLLPVSPLELAMNHFGVEADDLNKDLPGVDDGGWKLLASGRVKLYTYSRGTLLWVPPKAE